MWLGSWSRAKAKVKEDNIEGSGDEGSGRGGRRARSIFNAAEDDRDPLVGALDAAETGRAKLDAGLTKEQALPRQQDVNVEWEEDDE